MRLLAPKTHAPAAICLFLALAPALLHPQTPDPPQIPSVQISKQPAPPQRIPREQALTSAALDGTLREQISPSVSRPVAGAQLSLRNMRTNQTITAASTGDGVFRIVPLAPGTYELHVQAVGYTDFAVPALALNANEVLTLEILLAPAMSSVLASRLPRQPELGPSLPAEAVASTTSYREFRHRLDADPNYILELAPDVLPPAADVFSTFPNRWQLPQPDYRRYPNNGESIYAKPHWYDPFNHNRWKGDEPIWPELFGQQVFLDVTATAETFLNPRYLPTPTNISPARPGTSDFFGNGAQFFLDQTLSVSFDLFHGDTSFKPVDWRIRITPELSLNYLDVQELGIVNVNPQNGTTRFDDHVGLQEAFFEVKLHDLSPNYDFISARAGIQQFNARGFLFVDEQPGLRVFGDWASDRFEYNAAYFNLLEKNTNSELNSFAMRQQQVVIANLYWQDFFFPGYTAEFVGAWNKDDGGIHYNDDGFLVRPAPIGNVVNQGVGFLPHGIRVGYFSWLGSGHIRRLNLTNAFYEAAGEDTFNPIAGRKVTVNAQMAALELSYDKDWIRYRVSSFYASGDANPRDGRANGFDTSATTSSTPSPTGPWSTPTDPSSPATHLYRFFFVSVLLLLALAKPFISKTLPPLSSSHRTFYPFAASYTHITNR